MTAASPVSIRSRTWQPADVADEALADETARWGMYGDVVACDLDAAGHPTTIVVPRATGPAVALHAAVAAATRRGTHELIA